MSKSLGVHKSGEKREETSNKKLRDRSCLMSPAAGLFLIDKTAKSSYDSKSFLKIKLCLFADLASARIINLVVLYGLCLHT